MKHAKSVLVTGASGFIGKRVVDLLKRRGWVVTSATRLIKGEVDVEEIYLDLNHPESILELAKRDPFDAIVHIAAHVGWSGAGMGELFVPNVLASGCLAFLAKNWDSRVVYVSAAIVCGLRTEKIDIDSPVCVENPYAKSKWLGELLFDASDTTYCNLRVGGVYGKFGPSHLGINRAIDRAIRGEPPERIGSGTSLRNYIYVDDVANAIDFSLNEKIVGTHLLAGSEIISISEMLQEICNVFLPGLKPVLRDGNDSPNQVITPSVHFPQTRKFRDALIDIKDGNL